MSCHLCNLYQINLLLVKYLAWGLERKLCMNCKEQMWLLSCEISSTITFQSISS